MKTVTLEEALAKTGEFLADLTYACYKYNRDLGMSHKSLIKVLELKDARAARFAERYEKEKKGNGA